MYPCSNERHHSALTREAALHLAHLDAARVIRSLNDWIKLLTTHAIDRDIRYSKSIFVKSIEEAET